MYSKNGISLKGPAWVKAANSDDDFLMQNVGFENVEATFSMGDPFGTDAENAPFVLRPFEKLERNGMVGEVWVRGVRGKIAIATSGSQIDYDDGGTTPDEDEVKILRTYDYKRSWEGNFTLPQLDDNGWSIFTPSANSRIMFVSSSLGDDAAANLNQAGVYSASDFSVIDYRNPGQVIAFKTIEAALANARSGYADYILCKRGDVFPITSMLQMKAGESAIARSLISFYGQGPLPVLEHRTTNNITLRGWYGDGSFTAVQGLRFNVPEKDENHPDFVGYDNIQTDPKAIVYYSAGRSSARDMLVEGCVMGNYNTGVSFGSGTSGVRVFDNAIIRRTLIHDSYKSKSGGHPQGIGGGVCSIMVDSVYLVRCGHKDAVGTSSPATIFSHSSYFTSIENSVFKEIVSVSPSSIHLKFASNPPVTTADYNSWLALSQALTSSSETQIVVNHPINEDTPKQGTLEIKANDGSLKVVNYTDWDGFIFTIEAADFSGKNANAGNMVSYTRNTIFTKNVSIQDNVLISGEVGVSIGGNNDRDNTYARFSNVNIQGNLLDQIGFAKPTGRNLGYGFEIKDHVGATVSENLMLAQTNPLVTATYLFSVSGDSSTNSIFNNVGVNQGASALGNSQAVGNLINPDVNLFVDSQVHIEDYSLSLGGQPSIEGFEDLLMNQTMDSYDERLSAKAINAYFRKRYAISNGFVILKQVKDVSALDGFEAHFDFEVFANKQIASYQWYRVGVGAIPGQTYSQLKLTASQGVNGSQYYCRATDTSGQVYTSEIGTLSLSETQFYYDIANENVGMEYPAFLREAVNNEVSAFTQILESDRPDGSVGNVWDLDANDSV